MYRNLRHTLAPAIVAVLALSLQSAAASPWKVPDPATQDHPGAKEAPASSPRTFPDEEGFQKRRNIVIDGLKDEDLGRWRRGYFTGGDPGKYSPGAIMAKLLRDPKAADAIAMLNDDRSHREHYHFAAVNWARVLPLFGDALTDDTKKKLAERAFRYGYFDQGGTENHKTMWLTASAVLPSYLEGGRLHFRGKNQALAESKRILRNYVKGMYAAGNGEWDSSTYMMFTAHGLMCVYDFAEDPETRLIAKAGLDWFMTGYAVKYRDGLFTAPNQRGFAHEPVRTITDQTGWLWWGSSREFTPETMDGSRYAMHAVTSGYRPNAVLTNIATQNLPKLPVEYRNSKANYWGIDGTPRGSVMHETVYVSKNFTMGTLWNGHGSQIARFQVTANSDDGGVQITGGNPRQSDHTGRKTGIGFRDGNSRYAQFAASNNTAIAMAQAPDDDDDAKYSFVSLPEGVQVQQHEGWTVFPLGKAVVAVYPLGGGKPEVTQTPPDRRGNTTPMLKIPGQRSGFVVKVFDNEGADPATLANALRAQRVDASKFASDMQVTVRDDQGRTIQMTFNPATEDDRHGNRTPHVVIDGKQIEYGNWPVFESPYVNQKDGVLTVTDGKQGYSIDFSGDLPVYRTLNR